MKKNNLIRKIYKFSRKGIFLTDSEWIHENMASFSEALGKSDSAKNLVSKIFNFENKSLVQKINGIEYKNPVGLAAGFDYEAKFPQILPSIGFGSETIGTITNLPYEGNPKPRLGRLIKSKSIMVYKGFKNPGIIPIVKKLKDQKFKIPIGLSIGKTNSQNILTQETAIEDIISAFKVVENSEIAISYYELNISCPNLFGDVTFYPSKNLSQLLKAVIDLKIKKPIYVKMPTDKSNQEIEEMLKVIVKYEITGVIFGNLQKNRKDPSLDPEEVVRYKNGSFSGMPAQKRSNQLIKLAYKKFGKKLTIIGCGGVFSAEDAYKKIKLGASLIQLITGLVFEGPQLVSEINQGLTEFLQKDGFRNISEAIGKDSH